MRLDGKKIGTYSAIITTILGAVVLILFGLHPFGCLSGNIDSCIGSMAVTTFIVYLFVYVCIWFLVRFGNIGGVRHDDQF